MSDGMGRELAYLSSHATNRYFIPNWGKVCPLVRDIIGRVVSPVVAPPTLMGANGPKNCRNSGAQSKAMSSLRIL